MTREMAFLPGWAIVVQKECRIGGHVAPAVELNRNTAHEENKDGWLYVSTPVCDKDGDEEVRELLIPRSAVLRVYHASEEEVRRCNAENLDLRDLW